MYFRSYNKVAALFAGLELVPPGVTSAPHWHPEPGVNQSADSAHDVYVGVGRKP
jgi:hypothetical protein